jgi:putative NADPH-quinone reductase
MRVHLVTAHPLPDSYHAAVRAAVLAGLRQAGHAVDHLDLYAENFQPALSTAERRDYYDLAVNQEPVADYVRRLQQAEALVLCFPTWWYSMPAIVKGYLDRVMVPGVAFHMPQGSGDIRPGLTNLRKLGVVTTAGSPWWLVRLVMGEPNRAMLMRGLRRLMAPRTQGIYLTHYDMDHSTPASRARFLRRVQRRFASF